MLCSGRVALEEQTPLRAWGKLLLVIYIRSTLEGRLIAWDPHAHSRFGGADTRHESTDSCRRSFSPFSASAWFSVLARPFHNHLARATKGSAEKRTSLAERVGLLTYSAGSVEVFVGGLVGHFYIQTSNFGRARGGRRFRFSRIRFVCPSGPVGSSSDLRPTTHPPWAGPPVRPPTLGVWGVAQRGAGLEPRENFQVNNVQVLELGLIIIDNYKTTL